MTRLKARGTLSPNVHLLSQLSTEPHPQVQISLVFPEYFGNLGAIAFKQGQSMRVLTSIENNPTFGNDTIYISAFTGAFVDVKPSTIPGQ